MTTLREAAQQALKALCRCTPEQRTASDALRAALAQQEQEPVAWMFQHEETRRMNYVSNDGCNSPGRFLVMNPRYALVCALYTHPPRREWRGLTMQEINALPEVGGRMWNMGSAVAVLRAIRAIEQALKEKNA